MTDRQRLNYAREFMETKDSERKELIRQVLIAEYPVWEKEQKRGHRA